MRKRSKHHSSNSESSSEEECLITLVKRNRVQKLVDAYNVNPSNALLQESQQSCEFCEGKFTNKFESLIHNARHIVIPLLRQSFITCSMCNQIFPSQVDADEHTQSNHPVQKHASETQDRLQSEIVFEEDVIVLSDSETHVSNKIILGSKKVEKADILNSFTSSCIVNVQPLDLPSDTNEHETQVKPSEEPLTFDLRSFNGIVIDGLPDVIRETLSLSQPLEDPMVSVVVESSHSDGDGEDEGYDSIPYSELTLPIFHKCEHCKKTFTNKYKYLKHKAKKHLRISLRLFSEELMAHTPEFCSQCRVFFARSESWIRHLKASSHARTRIERCEVCFNLYTERDDHMRLYHAAPAGCKKCTTGLTFLNAYCHKCQIAACVECSLTRRIVKKYDVVTAIQDARKCAFCSKISANAVMVVKRKDRRSKSDRARTKSDRVDARNGDSLVRSISSGSVSVTDMAFIELMTDNEPECVLGF